MNDTFQPEYHPRLKPWELSHMTATLATTRADNKTVAFLRDLFGAMVVESSRQLALAPTTATQTMGVWHEGLTARTFRKAGPTLRKLGISHLVRDIEMDRINHVEYTWTLEAEPYETMHWVYARQKDPPNRSLCLANILVHLDSEVRHYPAVVRFSDGVWHLPDGTLIRTGSIQDYAIIHLPPVNPKA